MPAVLFIIHDMLSARPPMLFVRDACHLHDVSVPQPMHQVMVANIRCSEIKNDQLRSLEEDQAWKSLVEQVRCC